MKPKYIHFLKSNPWWVWPAILLAVLSVFEGVIIWSLQGYFPVGLFPLVFTGYFCLDMIDAPEKRHLRLFAMATYKAWLFITALLFLVWLLSGSGWPSFSL